MYAAHRSPFSSTHQECKLGEATSLPLNPEQHNDMVALFGAVPPGLRGMFRVVTEAGVPIGLRIKPDYVNMATNALIHEYNRINDVEPLPLRPQQHAEAHMQPFYTGEEFATILRDAHAHPPRSMPEGSVEKFVFREGYEPRRTYRQHGKALEGCFMPSQMKSLPLPPREQQIVTKINAHIPPDLQDCFVYDVLADSSGKLSVQAFGVAPNLIGQLTAEHVLPSLTRKPDATHEPMMAGIRHHSTVFSFNRTQLTALAQHLLATGQVLS